MTILTRSEIVLRVFRIVWPNIPPADCQRIESVLYQIRCVTEWRLSFCNDLKREAGLMRPCWPTGVPGEGQFAHILFILPIFRLFSARAQVGIVALELGHVLRVADLEPGWYKYIETRYEAEERLADEIAAWQASRWLNSVLEALSLEAAQERDGSVAAENREMPAMVKATVTATRARTIGFTSVVIRGSAASRPQSFLSTSATKGSNDHVIWLKVHTDSRFPVGR